MLILTSAGPEFGIEAMASTIVVTAAIPSIKTDESLNNFMEHR
jgi:hypothetical protein